MIEAQEKKSAASAACCTRYCGIIGPY